MIVAAEACSSPTLRSVRVLSAAPQRGRPWRRAQTALARSSRSRRGFASQRSSSFHASSSSEAPPTTASGEIVVADAASSIAASAAA